MFNAMFDFADEGFSFSQAENDAFYAEAGKNAAQIVKILDNLLDNLNTQLEDFDPNKHEFCDQIDASIWQNTQLEEAIFLLEAAACQLTELKEAEDN